MQHAFLLLIRAGLAAIVTLCLSLSAQAQNPFAPIVKVNEDIVTQFELDQRQRFLQIISPANSGRERALNELIDDRLRQQATRQAGLALNEQDIADGMAEFAGRANLTAEQFITILNQRGIAVETFRDFVSIGLLWRDLIRGIYGNRVQITDAEIDRALSNTRSGAGIRVLLSEIIMPAPPPQQAAVLARAERISQSTTFGEFSAAARRYSATASRGAGGRLNWMPLGNLPPQLHPLILALSPGEVTAPIPIPNAVALFQLRDIEETGASEVEYAAVEYARYLIPGGRSDAALNEAKRVTQNIDVCDDLYGIAQGQPEENLLRDSKPPADIPRDIALELAKLDEGEVSTALTTSDGQALILLMLCGRTAAVNEDVSRDAVAGRLRQERLSGFADSLLEQLRADARIREQ